MLGTSGDNFFSISSTCKEPAAAFKLIQSLTADGLFRFEQSFADFFTRLRGLDDSEPQVMMSIVQGHHPVRKMATPMLELRRKQTARSFDFQPLVRLVRTILERNYQYWLGEEDPLPWFTERCGDYCREWQGQELLEAISHARMHDGLRTLAETGVDRISIGTLTKDVKAIDFSMRLQELA